MLAGADTIEIILHPSTINTDTVHFFIRDKEMILEILRELSLKNEDTCPCAVNGKMRFYKARIDVFLMEAEFGLRSDCAFMVFPYQEKQHIRTLLPDGAAFLRQACQYPEAFEDEEIL